VQAEAALAKLATLAGPAGDVTPPVISDVSSLVTNQRSGQFQISWTTDEPATSEVELNGKLTADPTLTTSHTVGFRGRKGLTFTYWVISKDAAGNIAADGPYTHQN
jgi:hypothetical protein